MTAEITAVSAHGNRVERELRAWLSPAQLDQAPADANDFLWAWGSSADYDAAPGLTKIEAPILVINAADDERNPPETGVMERAMKSVKNATR